MKILLLSLLSLVSFAASAIDLAETHQALCSSEEVQSQMGKTDTCRIVIATSKAKEIEGVCTGKFRGVMPCTAAFAANDTGAAGIHLICGFDSANPALDQGVDAELSAYKVAAVVSGPNGSQVVVADKGDHGIIDSGMMSIMLSKYGSTTTARISLNLKDGSEELTDVVCQ